MKTVYAICCVISLFAGTASAGGGEEKIQETAHAVLAKHQEAIVSVKIAGFNYLEIDGKKERQGDFKLETPGTVVTPSGITAVTRFDSGPPVGDPPGLPGEPVLTPKFEFTEARIAFKNGHEIHAEIVYRDDKFGIVYLAPKAKDLKLAYIRFEKAKAPNRLDRLISLSRLDSKFDLEAEINTARITSLVKKSRTLIVADSRLFGAVFDANGHPVGIAGICRGENQSVYGPDDRQVIVDAEILQAGIREATKGWEKTKTD